MDRPSHHLRWEDILICISRARTPKHRMVSTMSTRSASYEAASLVVSPEEGLGETTLILEAAMLGPRGVPPPPRSTQYLQDHQVCRSRPSLQQNLPADWRLTPTMPEWLPSLTTTFDAADTHVGADAVKSPASRRVFNNRQMIKSSLDAKQRFQDALDTAKASELALREMISSWRAAK